MRTEQEFLVDALGRLEQTGVEYMLTGSMASNYWGIPRTTHDLDFVVTLQPEDVHPFVEAFRDGCFIQLESVRAAFQPPYQFNVIDEQSALKADFWQLSDNSFERESFARRLSVTMFGVDAWIATAEDILLHKLYWNKLSPSDRQLRDAAGVYAVQKEALDREYLRHWANILGVTKVLEDVISGGLPPKAT